jgi:C-terminal processing protease CtpA/Prc
MSKDTLLVSSLTEPSPASEAGLQLQDRIIRLGNTPVAELDYCQVLEQLDTVQQIQLTIENGHRTQTVKLVKRDLYKSP